VLANTGADNEAHKAAAAKATDFAVKILLSNLIIKNSPVKNTRKPKGRRPSALLLIQLGDGLLGGNFST
jgi:hypothetical protein